MSQFSTTRVTDHANAVASNVYLAPAIRWLRGNTSMGRLSDIEVYEALQAATAGGAPFVITYNTHSVP